MLNVLCAFVFCVFFGLHFLCVFVLFCFSSGGGSVPLCVYIVFIAAVWASSSLDVLLTGLVTLLPVQCAARSLWCTECRITNCSGMSTSIGHSLN